MSTATKRKRKPTLDVTTLDWSRSNGEIAAEYGISEEDIETLRINNNGGLGETRIEWELVDWKKSDSELGEELNRTRERVRQKRVALKMPKTPRRSMSRSAQKKVSDALELNLLSNQSRIEAARTIGVAPSTFDKYRRIYKVKILDGRYTLTHKLWNFNLPNADLERIWQLKRNSAANTRSRLRKGPPNWNIQRGSVPEDEDYFKAIKAEERKAQAFFAKQNA